MVLPRRHPRSPLAAIVCLAAPPPSPLSKDVINKEGGGPLKASFINRSLNVRAQVLRFRHSLIPRMTSHLAADGWRPLRVRKS